MGLVNTWGPQLNQFCHQVEDQKFNHNHTLDNNQNILTYLMGRDASLNENLANYVITLFEEQMTTIYGQLHSIKKVIRKLCKDLLLKSPIKKETAILNEIIICWRIG